MQLAKKRKAKKMTQEQLAAEVGCSRVVIAQLEAGWQKPWPKIRRKLAEVLGAPEGEIFDND